MNKKLIALAMLCYLLEQQKTIELCDPSTPALGFKHCGKYPYQFDTIDEVNAVCLPDTPSVVLTAIEQNGKAYVRLTFGSDAQLLPIATNAVEAAALKRYMHYVNREVDDVRGYLQSVYRVLFNDVPRKQVASIQDYRIDVAEFLLSWTFGEWDIEVDLNHLIGPTAIEVFYDYRAAQNLLVITENYGQFESTHYVDLLLHSTAMGELKARAIAGVIHLSKRHFLNNVTQLPIKVKSKRFDKELVLTLK